MKRPWWLCRKANDRRLGVWKYRVPVKHGAARLRLQARKEEA